MASRSWIRRATYNATRLLARLFGTILLQIRCGDRPLLPAAGAAIVCSNHQSFLDPFYVGLACERRLNFLARESLFRWKPFAHVLEWYDTIPIQRDGFGLTGMRETMRRLRRGELMMIYPEGTRTRDGQLGPLKPGICTLARRAQVPLVPVAIAGGFEVWPRDQRLPRWGRVAIQFGPPISLAEVQRMSDEELLAELRQRMEQCLSRAYQLGSIQA